MMTRSARRGVLVLATLVFSSRVAAAQGPPSGLPLDSVVAYSGVYAAGPHETLVISAHRAPFGVFPLLSDLRTGEMRLLVRAGRDTFVAGPELARMDSVQTRVVFRRGGNGQVDAIEISAPGRTSRLARRRDILRVEVTLRRGDVTLPGTLYLPPAVRGRRAPAVVLAHGSEDSDRHAFGALPLALAQHGFAALAFDKRGTGAAGGSWEEAGIEELADDVAAAVALARARAEIDPGRVCVLGFSEGGWVAPRAATKGDVACIVAISGGGRTKGETFVYKNRRLAEERGLVGAALDSAVESARATIRASAERVAQGRGSGFDRRVTYDPSADWRAFRGPVLVMLGEYDVLEDARASAEWLRALFAEAGHPDRTVHVFPGAHHGLLVGADPTPGAIARMRGVRGYSPGYWATLLWWLERRVGSGGG